MRLIDVDKFVFYTPRQSDGEGLFVKWLKEILNKAPTVDAIPVEWLRQFKDTPVTDESAKRCDECGGDFVEWMILEWAERNKPCDDCQQFDCYGCEYAERKER